MKKNDSNFSQIAFFTHLTLSEGPGKRFALWFQGCSIRCPGCIRKDLWENDPKKSVPLKKIYDEITFSVKNYSIEGTSFLGGEPFDQKNQLLKLLLFSKSMKLNTIVFTGFTYEYLKSLNDKTVKKILSLTDALVDGPFVEKLKTDSLYLRGSTNQKIILLSDTFKPEDFNHPNSFTIKITKNSEVEITGFPFDKIRL